MNKVAFLALALALLAGTSAQPFSSGTGFLPTGNLRTSDRCGPYNLTLLSDEANQIKAGIAARQDYCDKDIVDFLTNVECLEGLFDTWGTFGHGFLGNLELGGPTPIGARKANLTAEAEQYMQEVALNEQGHALFTRQAGGDNPCPAIDFITGFNMFYAAAFNLTPTATAIEETFGTAFDPFLNDETFITSVLALEELGATGNKGLAGITSNPVLSTAIAGLATSATAQATIERILLWERRNNIVQPFNETVQQVFARISAYRDRMDGPQFDDQGLVNTDPRTIAVPDGGFNAIPTNVRGITFNRTPKMLLNILLIGNTTGKGSFFPNGVHGAINNPVGYGAVASGLNDFPSPAALDGQETAAQVGTITPPLSDAYNPATVPGSQQLSQRMEGPITTSSYLTRGYVNANFTDLEGATTGPDVELPVNSGRYKQPNLTFRMGQTINRATYYRILKNNKAAARKAGVLTQP